LKILQTRSHLRNKKGIFINSLSKNNINKIMKIRDIMNLTYNKKKSPSVRWSYHYDNK
jgi:hypothetical protein